MVASLVTLIFLLAIIYALVRYFCGGILGGDLGLGTAFIAHVVRLTFRAAWKSLRGAGRFYLHERRRRIKLPRERRGDRLGSAIQRGAARAARTTPASSGPYMAPDEADRRPGPVPPGYPKDRFEELWQAHLRSLDELDADDWPDDLLARCQGPTSCLELS